MQPEGSLSGGGGLEREGGHYSLQERDRSSGFPTGVCARGADPEMARTRLAPSCWSPPNRASLRRGTSAACSSWQPSSPSLSFDAGRGSNAGAAAKLGRALSGIRTELGLTQDELAYRGRKLAESPCLNGREGGGRPPLVRCTNGAKRSGWFPVKTRRRSRFSDATPQLILLLGNNPEALRSLSPERFEHFVAERIDRHGLRRNSSPGPDEPGA